MTTKLMGVREFRQNISELYKKGQKEGIRYIVLNKNTPIFEVRPLTKKDSSLERLLAVTSEARNDAKAGRVYALEDLEKELGII